MSEIRQGLVFLHGRSREAAQRAIAAARHVGQHSSVVRTTEDGYLVPEEVAQAIEDKSYLQGEPVEDAPQPQEQEEVEESGDGLDDLNKDALIEAAKERGLATGGNKADLIERIREHDAPEPEQAQESEGAGSEDTSEDEKE